VLIPQLVTASVIRAISVKKGPLHAHHPMGFAPLASTRLLVSALAADLPRTHRAHFTWACMHHHHPHFPQRCSLEFLTVRLGFRS
jgi:hypothetical protein